MSTGATNTNRRSYAETAVQKASLVVGIAFLLVGLMGFIPGITTNFSEMEFAGHESGAMLLGIFQVSILHNIVHLLFGVLGVALARSRSGAKNFLVWGGVVYALFWLYGMFIGHDTAANFVPFNTADNWLHFVLAAGMIALGLVLPRRDRDRTTRV